jgi:hypothetical protein|tara:strand:+ start:346 stop:720 length:375 start_codon:yes stop_codon:yes gene_type:complete
MSMLLGIPNSNYITLDTTATYGYRFIEQFDKYDIRTKGGSLFTYITAQGNYNTFKIPMSFVTSSDRSLINSWFSTATDLRFIEDNTFANSYYTVRLVGKTDPFTVFKKPYFRQFYDGELVLETV